MKRTISNPINRRSFLGRSAAVLGLGAAGVAGGMYWRHRRSPNHLGRKVIVLGIDGMDPRLCESMMREGLLPNLQRIRSTGGYSRLATSMPPQSPVAWASFINGAGPGSHGIFDFIHRHPNDPLSPFYSAAETLPGEGSWTVGDHQLQLPFWPFNHKPPSTVLRRQGIPFWDYLDAAGISSTFFDLPSNYPPSPSQHGFHRCISGMGTPDMLGTYGTYQHFSEDAPEGGLEEGGGKRAPLRFENDSARAAIVGPVNRFLTSPSSTTVDISIHRDTRSNAAVIEVQGRKILLNAGQWSPWTRLSFALSMPTLVPTEYVSGICRLYLQQVSPSFRLYVSPINIDPTDPAVPISEPAHFVNDISRQAGLFYTTGFKEDHKALSNGVFDDDEFSRQATSVLDERIALLEHALKDYDDGLLFFYFSSSDLQSHMLWWDSEQKHPTRTGPQAAHCFGLIKQLYRRLDSVIGQVHDRFGATATILVLSDHGFANFARQFNLNSWLRDRGFIVSPQSGSVLQDVDWSRTRAYGLGINGLYLNLKGREADGVVEPGEPQEQLTRQLIDGLQAVRDANGERVIRHVYRSSELYSGNATGLAPDLIVGYARGYRASWETCLGEMTPEVLSDNRSAWSADHCADALEVPGVLFCTRPIRHSAPSLVDLAPTILSEFGLPAPPAMTGRNVFAS
jgi:predicted AlkP superfamily phosphohydrolase/phosphomutase